MLANYHSHVCSSSSPLTSDTAISIDSSSRRPIIPSNAIGVDRRQFFNSDLHSGSYSPPLMPFRALASGEQQFDKSFDMPLQVPNNSLATSPLSSVSSSPNLSYRDMSTLCSGMEKIQLAPLPPPSIVSNCCSLKDCGTAGFPKSSAGTVANPVPSHSGVITSNRNSEQNIWRSPDEFSLYNSGRSFDSSNSVWLSGPSSNHPSHINNNINKNAAQSPNTFSPRSFRSTGSSNNGGDFRPLHSPESLSSSWKHQSGGDIIPTLRLPVSSISMPTVQPQPQQKPVAGAKQLARMPRKLELDQEALRKYADCSIHDFKGQLYTLSKDQYGCRYVQKLLQDQPAQTCAAISAEVIQHFPELITDPFGNYMTQKFIAVCNSQQRTALVKSIAPHLTRIARDMHGTRAVQKLIEQLDSDIQAHLISKGLERETFELIRDLNANHVIQKCLRHFTAEFNQFIYNVAMRRCAELSCHRHGCCVIQRCIDQANLVQRENLIREIARCTPSIIEDPFGNYVVQYVLDLRDPAYVNAIATCLVGRVCAYSMQKFSSNVVEKCLRVSNRVIRQQLIHEFFKSGALDLILRDSYGNYVLQTALESAEPNQRHLLIEACLPLLDRLNGTAPGRRLINKLLQLEPNYMNQFSIAVNKS